MLLRELDDLVQVAQLLVAEAEVERADGLRARASCVGCGAAPAAASPSSQPGAAVAARRRLRRGVSPAPRRRAAARGCRAPSRSGCTGCSGPAARCRPARCTGSAGTAAGSAAPRSGRPPSRARHGICDSCCTMKMLPSGQMPVIDASAAARRRAARGGGERRVRSAALERAARQQHREHPSVRCSHSNSKTREKSMRFARFAGDGFELFARRADSAARRRGLRAELPRRAPASRARGAASARALARRSSARAPRRAAARRAGAGRCARARGAHRVPERAQRAPDLALAPLAQHQRETRARVGPRVATPARATRAGAVAARRSSATPAASRASASARDRAAHVDLVLALDSRSDGMQQRVRQRAVVGEQHAAPRCRGRAGPPGRAASRRAVGRQQVEHRAAGPPGSRVRREHAARLVQHPVAVRARARAAGRRRAIVVARPGRRRSPSRATRAVHAHAARADQRLGARGARRCPAAARSFWSRARRAPCALSASSGAAARVSALASGRSRRLARRRRGARAPRPQPPPARPRLRALGGAQQLLDLAQRRQILEPRQAEHLEEAARGARRASGGPAPRGGPRSAPAGARAGCAARRRTSTPRTCSISARVTGWR